MNCCCHVFLMTLMSRATNDVQEFVNIDKDLQTVQDISDVNIIILIYLFIKHVLFILMYLYKCKMHVSRVESLSFHMITHNFRFSMSLSLSPNSLYCQTTDCTEGGSLTREHCISNKTHLICTRTTRTFEKKKRYFYAFKIVQCSF